MRTRFKRGNTQENNSLVLLAGELSIDIEKKALRIHDGITPGGLRQWVYRLLSREKH
jgi:hypothetical protein